MKSKNAPPIQSRSPGTSLLPTHHITIRVPWHDNGWNGTVCSKPVENTSCLVLPRIGESKKDDIETRCAGQRIDELEGADVPPCAGERVTFMSPFELVRTIRHPYIESSAATHGHFVPTRFVYSPYSAACVPYRWMLRGNVEGDPKNNDIGIAERLQIGWAPDREPDLKFSTVWVQEGENQRILTDTFFSALSPKESLCFIYAKRTPLSEQSRRVIIGVGRVLSISKATEYDYNTKNPPLRGVLWERNVGHSIRPGFKDGFLFPYHELMALASRGEIANPEEFVAFAPDEQFDSYSYGSELLTNDGAVSSLIACAAALHRIRECVEGPWADVLSWIDTQLNRLWKARGAFPGLGSALSAFGYEWGFKHGSLLAYEIELERERSGGGDPWQIVDEVMRNPNHIKGPVAKLVTPGMRTGWKMLKKERRALIEMISRSDIDEKQALRIYDKTARKEADIEFTDDELLANPYLLFECDRRSDDPISFGSVDRGSFPDESVRSEYPVPKPTRVDDPVDSRRVRALVVDILEKASTEGHTVLPQSWIIRTARSRALRPECPLGENVFDVSAPTFGSVVRRVATGTDEPAYQVDRLIECREIIRREVRGRQKGKAHISDHDWRALVNEGLGRAMPSGEERELEERARQEKSTALEQLYRSRLSVLVGPAGTGKTTLLKMLCSFKDIAKKGVLLLAPTGKARVRLEEQTSQRGSGRTLAQFLMGYKRYDGATGRYFSDRSAPRCSDYRTVIIDECSMLTEDQLAALFDACTNVERYILVGDPRQLPPIGAGRPFVDIINELAPENVEAKFPRCAPGYGELTVLRRQAGTDRVDVLLAEHFGGKPLDPGADEIWDKIIDGGSERLKTVQWSDSKELQRKMLDEVVVGLGLSGLEDELGFELTLGGINHKNPDRAFFWNRYGDNPGAASKAEAWQILSPVRSGIEGVDSINRSIQECFRSRWRKQAEVKGWMRMVSKPFGPQAILYGDKVINIVNQRRRDVYPKVEGEAYIANGDLGIVVGQYKTKHLNGLPWKLEVEFAGQLGIKYGFSTREFGDEAKNPLELAYALTVHKTQGSEFGITFVVLPNPCWLLSRELLYTALTRHREKLIVLHRGPLADFRRFASEEYSEIARRMTNLFMDPRPREVLAAKTTRFLEESLIHRSERGDLVRSKSELIIADKLHARQIEYVYEQPLSLGGGRVRYPDFTITDHAQGTTYYWEHLGMLGDPVYKARWERKRAEYIAAGIKPWEEGGGSEGTLIETHDEASGGLDSAKISKLVERIFVV